MSYSTDEKEARETLPQSSISVLASLDTAHEIAQHIYFLSKKNASREEVQYSIQCITQQLLKEVASDLPKVVLVPVLRAGLSMWNAANVKYGMAETIFLEGRKDRQTGEAKVELRKNLDLTDKNLIILDPIIATGSTLFAVLERLRTNGTPKSLTVLTCYAAPEGVTNIQKTVKDIQIVVGCLAKGVDKQGYLFPATNGDLGDKLYGKAKLH